MNTTERMTNGRGHTVWREDDRNQLMDEYRKSRKTKKAFCMERGINLGTFYGWCKKARGKDKKSKETEPAFREVRLPVSSAAPVEITFPGGARVCLSNTGNQADFIKLIRGVAGC